MEKVKFFDLVLIKKVAVHHLTLFKHRIQVEGKDKTGARFRPYSQKYRERKARGFKKKDGSPSLAKAISGRALNTQISPPNFTLTGTTMRSVEIENERSDGYSFTWGGEPGLIVEGNMEKGRDIVGVPGNEADKVLRFLGIKMEQYLNKTIKNVTVNTR